MKKVLLTAVAVLGFAFANAQSHSKGAMQVNITGGFLTGNATSEYDDNSLNFNGAESKFTASGAQFGASFHYGIADAFSLGLGLEFGTVVLTPKDFNGGFGYTDPSLNAFKVNLVGRYYFVNKEKFNVYGAPSVGFTTAKDDAVFAGFNNVETKYSGLNYSVNVGGNYFFTDIVGVILNVGYEGNSLSFTESEAGFQDVDGKATLGGVKIMAGLALKF